MAKQAEGFIVGTYDDITFYKMGEGYYARMKTSLTGRKFWKHKAFEGSRRSCNRFGRGNQLASMVYREIPGGQREYALFCRMKLVAIAMIKAGKDEEEIIVGLREMKPRTEKVYYACKPKVVLSRQVRIGSLFRSTPIGATCFGTRNKQRGCIHYPVKRQMRRRWREDVARSDVLESGEYYMGALLRKTKPGVPTETPGGHAN